ncbi:HNH endonuclease [Rhodococcus phage ReqiPepy6]|uniref:Gp009 n=1 Tax=Rhodococcus phage ReqiPepy6 TaxID=691965 RepID=D4P7C0_9CAUD|nr:HNH endonuclease [Rhodococcus phage ReqiPepy6]ADD80900.1 gp009 [Rhodococcus phage ReqiPepy6]
MRIRRYSELKQIDTFIERFRYLALPGDVGACTFGFDRHINQAFYRSTEWRQIRHHVIARDLGCDLGIENREIYDKILIHHMNPMNVSDITEGNSAIIDPEFLICTSHKTHNAIHFGDENQLPKPMVERRPGDTKLW